MNNRKCLALPLFVAVLGVLVPAEVPAEGFIIEPKLGFGALGGDVGDTFKPGFLVGGAMGYELESGLALESEVSLLIMDPESGDASLAFDKAGFLSVSGGLRYFLSGRDAQVRPFLGGGVGISALGWDYTPAAESLLGIDSDGVGAFSVMGRGGIAVAASDVISFTFEGRAVLNAWGDKTSEDMPIDTDGHAVEIIGGLMITP